MADSFEDSVPSADGGTGNATKAVALTGDQTIDGVLTSVVWGGTSIDYAFPTSNNVYGYSQQTGLPNGFFATTLAQQNAARFALDANTGVNATAKAGFSVEGFTNLGVTYDSTPDSDQIRIANTTSSALTTAQVADFPGNYLSSQTQDNGDVWFGIRYRNTSNDYATPAAGNYAWHTHLHEIGHALGLKHGHEDSLAGPVPAGVDSVEFTVMTYRTYVGDDLNDYNYDAWSAPQTYMMLDVAALQRMYGADFTTNSGNTVYSWNPDSGNTLVNGAAAISPGGNRIFATIWDGGGIDTYDLSSYQTNLDIDLTPGGSSTFSATQLANLNGGPNGGLARGNIFNARQFQGDARSLIENANGGVGNDTITGNQASNTLDGRTGADTTDGGAGNDTILDSDGINLDSHAGGAGADTISYAGAALNLVTVNLATGLAAVAGGNSETIAGFENARGSQGADTVIGSAAANIVDGQGGDDRVFGGGGNDTGVVGGAGEDWLFGEAGNDTLRGGAGRDAMVGGSGNDRFDFDLVSDSVVGADCDILQAGGGGTAFDLPGRNNPGSAGDRIDVTTIDANANMGGNQNFIFGGAGIGHIRCVNAGNVTQVLAYVDSDPEADFQLNIFDGAVAAARYLGVDFVL